SCINSSFFPSQNWIHLLPQYSSTNASRCHLPSGSLFLGLSLGEFSHGSASTCLK
ncbi:hypothetical protein WG66_009762, partial [Moniliophthora roreri]